MFKGQEVLRKVRYWGRNVVKPLSDVLIRC